MEKKSATCRGGDAPCVLRNRRCSPCRRPTAWRSSHHRCSSTPRPRRAIPRAAPRATSGVASSCVRICRTAAKHRPKRRCDGRIGFRSKLNRIRDRLDRAVTHASIDLIGRSFSPPSRAWRLQRGPTPPRAHRPSPGSGLAVGVRRARERFAVDRSGRGRSARGVTGDSPRRSRRRRRGFRRGVRGRSRARVYSRVFSLVRGSLESRDNAAVDAPLSKPRSRPTMKHGKTFRKLGRDSAHRWAMMRTMVTQLIEHERIRTTVAKAKELRKVADRVVTYAKRGTLSARRRATAVVRTDAAVQKLFTESRSGTRAGPGPRGPADGPTHPTRRRWRSSSTSTARASRHRAARRRARAELGCQGVRAEAARGGEEQESGEYG